MIIIEAFTRPTRMYYGGRWGPVLVRRFRARTAGEHPQVWSTCPITALAGLLNPGLFAMLAQAPEGDRGLPPAPPPPRGAEPPASGGEVGLFGQTITDEPEISCG